MTKAAEMGKTSFKGSFHMLWGLVISTVISSIGTIIIAKYLLSDVEMGWYALAIAAATLIATFRDWGVNSAIVKYTAQYRSENVTAHIRSILTAGVFFDMVLGVALSVFSFLLSDLFAGLYGLPNIAALIQIASVTILLNAFIVVAQAAFTGLERMELNSVMLICQSLVKTTITPPLVIIGLGVSGAVLGYSVALLIAALTGMLLMWLQYKKLPSEVRTVRDLLDTTRMLLKYGLPLSLAAILTTFMAQFYTVLTGAYKVPADMIGNYTVAQTFVVLITFFSGPITTVLFPAFSKLDPRKDHETLQNVYQFSIKYASLLVVPVTSLVMALSQPGVFALFGDKYPFTPLFLALLGINYFYTAFGGLTAGNFINSQGQTKFNLKLTVLTVVIGFPLGFVLIPLFGILGLIGASLIAGIPSLIISLRWIQKRYDLTVDWVSSAKILFSSGVAGGVTFWVVSALNINSWILLALGVIVFVPVFILTALLTRTIGRSDIDNLKGMLSSLGSLNRIFGYVLGIIDKLMTILRL